MDKYWGEWKRGNYKPEIPVEPPQKAPRKPHVDWPSPTLPWSPSRSRRRRTPIRTKDSAALDALAYLAFRAQLSDLYQKLVVQEQKVDFAVGGLRRAAWIRSCSRSWRG